MSRHDRVWAAVNEGGKCELLPRERAAYRRWFAAAFQDGDELDVIVRRRRRARSIRSNAYWWAVVVKTLADECGYADPDDLHEALVMKFRPADPDPLTGSPRRESTHDKDSAWFSALIADVKLWAEADLGIVIPEAAA